MLMREKIVLYLSCFVSAGITTMICGPLIMKGYLNAFFFTVIFLTSIIAPIILVTMYYDKQSQELSKIITVSSVQQQLNLYKRCPDACNVLSIVPIRQGHLQYNPLEIKYTGFSVGGFSSGEITTSGNDFSYIPGEKTDKYQLSARVTNKQDSMKIDHVIIKQISLMSKDLVEQAKQDRFINQFLSSQN